MSITSKTQGKKLQREISLAQRIEPGRRMRWFDVDIIQTRRSPRHRAVREELTVHHQDTDQVAHGAQDID
jgi:hypothetical protein